jgi:hypothetical protein
MRFLLVLLFAGTVGLCAAPVRGQDSAPPQERPPALRCVKVKFVSESGQPFARQAIGLMWLQVDWENPPRPGSDVMKIPIKARKELKTNADGEISIPNLKGGPYLVELLVLIDGQEVYPEGHFLSSSKPESCMQLLEVKGQHVVSKP